MFKRLKTLVLMQITNRKSFSNLTTGKKVVHIALRILAIAIITAISGFVFFFFKNIMYLNVTPQLLLFLIGIIQIITIISHISSFQNELYLSKDNQILFSYPARHSEVFLSKLLVFYIKDFTKNLYFVIPLMLGFGLYTGITVGYLINTLMLTILLPLFPVLLGALLSLPTMLIKRELKRFPIVQTILNLTLISVLFYGILEVLKLLPVPLRILALYTSFINGVQNFIGAFNKYLIVYSNLVNTLFATRTTIDYLIVVGTVVGLALLVYLLAMPLYFNIVSHFSATSHKKVHKAKENIKRSSFLAFFRKEIKVLMRTPGKLYSYLSFVIAFPFLMYVMNYIFSIINTNPLGDSLVLGFNIMIGLVLLTANNTISATAISSEGEQFVVLKSAPNKTYLVAWTKIIINLFFSMIAIGVGLFAILSVTKMSGENLALIFILFFIVNSGHIFASFQLDILRPALREFAKSENISENPNVGSSIMQGLLISVAFTAIGIFFFLDSIAGGWVRLLVLGSAYLIIRLILFAVNLKVYFKRIEF